MPLLWRRIRFFLFHVFRFVIVRLSVRRESVKRHAGNARTGVMMRVRRKMCMMISAVAIYVPMRDNIVFFVAI